jgi:hypothetical protein
MAYGKYLLDWGDLQSQLDQAKDHANNADCDFWKTHPEAVYAVRQFVYQR